MLNEEFRKPTLDDRLKWFCAPAKWSVDVSRGVLVVEPDAQTDFWQKTYYGFQADNGHLLYAEVAGDMILTTRVRFHPANQYDQAGLMVRMSTDCWLKTSVEYIPGGPNMLGAVVTNHGYSDWSTQGFAADRNEIWLRVRREANDCFVECSDNGTDKSWSPLRAAHLHDLRSDAPAQCGLYACSPKGGGFKAEFHFLTIELGRIGQ